MAHLCPVHGGAHRYERDDPDAPRLCACGAVELAPEEELAVIEIAHEARSMPLPPRDSRRRMVSRFAAVMTARGIDGYDDAWVEEMLDLQEQGRAP